DDTNGVAPTVSITAPAPDASFVEGQDIPVTVSATDDVAVAAVLLRVDGQVVGTDSTAPYQFTVKAPIGVATTVLSATAIDVGGNVAASADVRLTVTPGRGRIGGRVTNQISGAPIANAIVRIFAAQGSLSTQTVSDTTGRYATDGLDAGTYFVTAEAAGFVAGLYANRLCLACNPTSGAPVSISDGASALDVDFPLAPFGRITGQVTNAQTKAALNDQVSVGLYKLTGDFVTATGIGPTGAYSF